MPARKNDQHARARRQARQRFREVPVDDLLTRVGILGVLSTLERIVYEKNIRALTGDP